MISINPINEQNYFPSSPGSLDFLKMRQEQGNLDTFKNLLQQGKTSNNGETPNTVSDGMKGKSTEDNLAKNLEKERLMQASKAFEALLIKEVFKSMRQNLNGDQLIGENTGTKLFKDFLFSERSQIAANQSDLGIAKIIFDQQSRYLQ